MSFTKAKAYLESVGFADHIMEPEASTATVVEAAGNDHSAVRLTIPELEQTAWKYLEGFGSVKWRRYRAPTWEAFIFRPEQRIVPIPDFIFG